MMIAKIEELITNVRPTECKDEMDGKGVKVSMNRTKVMVSGESRTVGVCGRGVERNSILSVRNGCTRSAVV